MTCPKCGSDNVMIQLVPAKKKRNIIYRMILFIVKAILFFVTLLWWFITMVLSLIFPALRPKKDVLRKYAVCQNCGYVWKIKTKDLKTT